MVLLMTQFLIVIDYVILGKFHFILQHKAVFGNLCLFININFGNKAKRM